MNKYLGAVYVVGGAVALYFVWKLYEELAGFGHEIGAKLDVYAETGGAAVANAITGPEILYDKARSAYAAKIGSRVADLTDWPSRDDWENYGAGPTGYTYGSPNYPKVQEATTGQKVLSFLSDVL